MTDFKFQKNWSRHPYARRHKDRWKNGLFADADGSRSKVFLEKGINQKDKKGSRFTNKGVPAPAFLGNRRKKSMRFERLFLRKRAQFLRYGLKLSRSAFRRLKKFEDRFLEYLLFFGGSKKYNWRFALDSYRWLFRRFRRKFKRIWVNKIPVAYGLFRLKRGWRLISLLEFKFGRSLGVWFWRFGRFGVGLKKRSAALSNLGVVGKKYLSFFNLWSKLKRRNRKRLKSFKLEESDIFKRYGDFNLISLRPFFLWYYCLNRYRLRRLRRSLLFSLRKYKDHFISYNTVEYSKVKLPELVMESNDFYRFFFILLII